MFAEEQIRTDSLERQYLIERILADMRAHPSVYNSTLMNCLFCYAPMSKALQDTVPDVSRFLKHEYYMTFADLYHGRVLPKYPDLREAVLKGDVMMPPCDKKDYRDPSKGRTDVYFLGLPGSGRSAILSGLLRYIYSSGGGAYLPRTHADYNRRGEMYCRAVMDGLDEFKVPGATLEAPVTVMPFNLGERRNRVLNFVEFGGGALIRLSRANQDNPEIWKRESLCRCLKNDNPKTLFFVLSYDMISNEHPIFSEPHQAEILENALLALNSNGGGKAGERKCTMSKVQTVAVVFSKSDLMNVKDEGKTKTRTKRREVAMKYLDSRFKLFMNNLGEMCEKYGINGENEHKPYVFTFSLGNFYIGNSVIYDLTDAESLCNFLLTTTRKKGIF